MKTTKESNKNRIRISWGLLCLIADITIIALVWNEWIAQGCTRWFSLGAASVFYTVGCLVVWMVFDTIIENALSSDEYYKGGKNEK